MESDRIQGNLMEFNVISGHLTGLHGIERNLMKCYMNFYSSQPYFNLNQYNSITFKVIWSKIEFNEVK